MKDLKKYLTEGLLQFTILLSLVGVRVDFDSYLPPIQEIILGTSSAYSQIPFHSLRDTWEGSSLHPKSPDLDSFFTAKRLLDEVRALGDTRIPRTEVSAWLVHAVSGDAEASSVSAAQAPLAADSSEGSSSSSTGTPSHSNEGPSQPSPSNSNLQQSHSTPAQPHIGTGATPSPADYTKETQEEKLGSDPNNYGYSYLQNEHAKTGLDENVSPQTNEEGNSIRDNTDVDPSFISTEINRNPTEPSLFFEEFIQLLAQTENALEGTSESTLHPTQSNYRMPSGNSVGEIWQDLLSMPELNINLEDIQPASSTNSVISPSTHYSVDFTDAISQDVSLQEAMFNSNPNSSTSGDFIQRQEHSLQLNSSSNPDIPLSVPNLTALFPSIDNSTRNLTHQDLLSGLDEGVFDEINLMSLALEEGFDPLEVSQLFDEPDSDSGLSLNSSRSPTSVSVSDSSSVSFGEDEGAAGYSSDSESVSYDGLEGAVGGTWPEVNKLCRMDYQEESSFYDELTLQNIQHNHTYNQLPDESEAGSEHHYSWPAKSGKTRSPCANGMDKNLSRDQRRAKSLKIPFSVDEIVSMPVEMFNNMLSKHYLTDTQISVIRDIRRRGKNKVAAQNCRKRKLDVILNLEDDVSQLRARKEKLLKERAQFSKSVSHMKQKLNELYVDVFSRLRDEQGRAVNPSQYSLHCNSDGSIMVVPRRLLKSEQKKDTEKDKKPK